jgi:hypothetical protein
MTRWEALVRYDDEIRAAAAKLFPFGDVWVDKLGEAFFALNEDRKYLPNIVDQLVKEAEHSAVVGWLSKFSKTAAGETTSEEAIAVLMDAHVKGYGLDVKTDKTILVTKSSSTSYVRSNAEILRFGKILSDKAAREVATRNANEAETLPPIDRDAF